MPFLLLVIRIGVEWWMMTMARSDRPPPSTSFCCFYTAVLPIYIYIIFIVETVSTATIVTAVGHTRKCLHTVFHAAYYYTHVISVYSKIH